MMTAPLMGGDLMLMGQQYKVTSPVEGSLLGVGSQVEIYQAVHGNIFILGGSLTLKAGARVSGTVTVVMGEYQREPSAIVRGEEVMVGPKTLISNLFKEPKNRLLWVLLWFFWACLLMAFMTPSVVIAGRYLKIHPWKITFMGLLLLVLFILLFGLGLWLLWFYIGAVILLVVVLGLFLLKLYGVVVCFYAVGSSLMGEDKLIPALFLGSLLLLGMRWIPLVGEFLWGLLTFPALGIATLHLFSPHTFTQGVFNRTYPLSN